LARSAIEVIGLALQPPALDIGTHACRHPVGAARQVPKLFQRICRCGAHATSGKRGGELVSSPPIGEEMGGEE
jgi:hypothetical protein